MRLLLKTEGIRPDTCAPDSEGTPLSQAAESGFIDIVTMLVADKRVEADQTNSEGRTPLSLAAEHAHKEVVELRLTPKTPTPTAETTRGEHHPLETPVQNMATTRTGVKLTKPLSECFLRVVASILSLWTKWVALLSTTPPKREG